MALCKIWYGLRISMLMFRAHSLDWRPPSIGDEHTVDFVFTATVGVATIEAR